MSTANISDETTGCVESCIECEEVCLRMAARPGIELAGEKQELVQLLYRCAQICQTAADFVPRGSLRHSIVCRVCADICEACAKECELAGEMEECVEACRSCAASCREVVD